MTGTIAILVAEDSPKWQGVEDSLMPPVFMGRAATTEEWVGMRRVYNLCGGEFPSVEQACMHQAVFITGSHHGANDDLPWIHQLADLLPRYLAAGA